MDANSPDMLTPEELGFIERVLPWCIMHPQQPIWGGCKEEEGLNKILDDLLRKKIFMKKLITFCSVNNKSDSPSYSKKQVECLVLTAKGRRAYICSTARRNFFYGADWDPNCFDLRKSKNEKWIKKQIQHGFVQGFLWAAGVDSPFFVARNDQNPFPFGIPDRYLEKPDSQVFFDHFMFHFADRTQRWDMEECIDAEIMIPYVPNLFNRKSHVVVSSDAPRTRFREINNTLGTIIDFRNKLMYFIFFELDYSRFQWQTRAMRSVQSAVSGDVFQWKIKNVLGEQAGIVRDAFIFYSEENFKALLSKRRKMKAPFRHVMPIPLTREGVVQLSSILRLGVDAYREEVAETLVKKIPDAALCEGSSFYPIKLHGRRVYNGTVLDFVGIASLTNIFNRCRKTGNWGDAPYVACNPRQRKIYTMRVQVPPAYIIEIEPEEN